MKDCDYWIDFFVIRKDIKKLSSDLIQTCHSPGETNLNEYEKKSECGKKNLNDIAPPPPSPRLILSATYEKYSPEKKKEKPSFMI